MKSTSYRTWVLIIGIVVAMVISIAAVVVGSTSSSAFSMTPLKKPLPLSAPSVVIQKVLGAVDWKQILDK